MCRSVHVCVCVCVHAHLGMHACMWWTGRLMYIICWFSEYRTASPYNYISVQNLYRYFPILWQYTVRFFRAPHKLLNLRGKSQMPLPLVTPMAIVTTSGTDMPSGFTHCKQKLPTLPHILEMFIVMHAFLLPLYEVCLESIEPFWISWERVAWPSCNLAASQSRLLHIREQSFSHGASQSALKRHWLSLCTVWPLHSQISTLSTMILALGKDRSRRKPNLGCREPDRPGWCNVLLEKACMRAVELGSALLWWSCLSPLAHNCSRFLLTASLSQRRTLM